MKRTEYSEHIEKIKCSEKFRAEMEKKLSAAPLEVHEYEDIVEGVERAGSFRISRFGAIAACLLIVGGVGLGFNGMKQIQTTDPSQIEYQELRVFPYDELFDLYEKRQVSISAEWSNVNDNLREDLIQTIDTRDDELNTQKISQFFSICQDWTWFTCDPKDMTENNTGSYVNFDIHPDGYERYTGVYYNLRVYNNGDAYLTKYDMANDSLPDHIESQYCYMLAGMAYTYFRDILKTEEIPESMFASYNDFNAQYYLIGNVKELMDDPQNHTSDIRFDLTEETKKSIEDLMLNAHLDKVEYEYNTVERLEDYLEIDAVCIGFNINGYDEIGYQMVVFEDGRLVAINDEDCFVYDVGTDFYNELKSIIENNEATLNRHEPVDQETINDFIDKYITNNIELGTRSQIMPYSNESDSDNYTIYTTRELEADNIDEVIEKMKSIEWEKYDPAIILSGENIKYTNIIEWKHSNDIVGFTDNGFLIRSDIEGSGDSYECYSPVNQEDKNEIINMLFSNMKNASPEDRLLSALSKGYIFENLKGTYQADFTVPSEISETNESYFVQSGGDIYIDKSAGGMMIEGKGTVSGDERRYLYLCYNDGKVRYDEAHGQGESTAHYNDYGAGIPVLDYLTLYKYIASEFINYTSDEPEKEIECIKDEENSDGTHSYSFLIKENNKERTLDIKVDEQGRLLLFKNSDENGKEIHKFELNADYIYDIDSFSMPVEFVNNH